MISNWSLHARLDRLCPIKSPGGMTVGVVMKKFAWTGLMLIAAVCVGQETIPAGTVLPVQMNSSLRSDKLKVGEKVSGRVMQEVPLGGGAKIKAGAKVIGQVVAVNASGVNSPAELAVRFETVTEGKKQIPIVTNLRAMATMMDVAEARVPQTGPDRGTSEYYWVTEQIGGETVYHGGGAVTNGLHVVGKAVNDGVLVNVAAREKCRDGMEGNERPQAMWLFSSDACGLYDLPGLEIVHAGRTDPVGEIRLRSEHGNVNVRAGSGVLLRVE